MQHACRNHQINGNSAADFLHQTAARQRLVSPQQPQVSLYSASRYLQTITRARAAAAMSRHAPAALLPFVIDRLKQSASQSGQIHKDNKDCRCFSEDAATSGTMAMSSLRAKERMVEVCKRLGLRLLSENMSTLGSQVLIGTRNSIFP